MVLTKKYKGNTLPEVLIAIVIISFTSAMGVTIYLNLQQNTQPFKHAKANELAKMYLNKSINDKICIDNQVKEEEFTIKQKWERSTEFPDCGVLSVAVSTKEDKVLCELKQLIYAN